MSHVSSAQQLHEPRVSVSEKFHRVIHKSFPYVPIQGYFPHLYLCMHKHLTSFLLPQMG